MSQTTMGAAPVAVGDSIADKYSVEHVVGEGGMGVVFAARHIELDQRVAIKFLLPEIAEQGMAAERFRREARAAAKIRGEHVCRVLDVGTLRNGIPYMVMEYLDGCDLSNELERRGRLPPEEAVGYLIEACDAVAEAHAAGIVHRDIKPANLFLATRSDGSRRIKVLDFGVSKSLLDSRSGQHALTITSSVVGSPLYMSPEQLDSAKDVDRRTDIWALGVVLYELLTGRTPFRGDSIPQLVTSVMHDTPAPFANLAVTAPDGLEAVVQRALFKSRDQRYGSIAELVSALAPFAPRHAGAMSVARSSRMLAPVLRDAAIGGTADTLAESSPRRTAAWAQGTTDRGTRSRWTTGLVAVVVMAAVLFALYHIAGGPQAPAATPNEPIAPSVALPRTAAEGQAALPEGSAEQPALPAASPSDRAGQVESPASTAESAAAAPSEALTPPTAAAPAAAVAVPAASPAAPAAPQPGATVQQSVPRKPPPTDRPRGPETDRSAPAASPTGVSDFGGRR
jgi:eukaryotic-like serine/threonine-protein kinase